MPLQKTALPASRWPRQSSRLRPRSSSRISRRGRSRPARPVLGARRLRIRVLSNSSLSAGPTGIAVAQGTHLGIVSGEFGGDAITAIRLPATSGSGTPAIQDWVTCSIPATPDDVRVASRIRSAHGLGLPKPDQRRCNRVARERRRGRRPDLAGSRRSDEDAQYRERSAYYWGHLYRRDAPGIGRELHPSAVVRT